MRKLAHLSILGPYQQLGLPATAFQQAEIASMQHLQSIELGSVELGKGMVLELPASLTRLQLGSVAGRGLVPETVPDLALGRLTNLVHLELSKVPIDGAVLAGVPQLRQLILTMSLMPAPRVSRTAGQTAHMWCRVRRALLKQFLAPCAQ